MRYLKILFSAYILGSSLLPSHAPAENYLTLPNYENIHFTPQESETIVRQMLAFIENLKQGNKEAVANQIAYPLRLALGTRINSSRELIQFYDRIFTADIVKQLTSNIDVKQPFLNSFKGCFINRGIIWFICSAGGATASVFNRLNGNYEKEILQEKFPDAAGHLEAGWKYKDEFLPPTCLHIPWVSGDDYECYEDHYGIKTRQLYGKLGDYWGNVIPLSPLQCYDRPIALYRNIAQCKKSALTEYKKITSHEFETKGYNNPDNGGFSNGYTSYTVLARWGKEKCKEALPYLAEQCQEVVLVSYDSYEGGTMTDRGKGAYALLETKEGSLIVPANSRSAK